MPKNDRKKRLEELLKRAGIDNKKEVKVNSFKELAKYVNGG
tara:strand:+ start:35467 stop:35589 length:123 start_codon:yes stop_codon:yes gene_type:complete